MRDLVREYIILAWGKGADNTLVLTRIKPLINKQRGWSVLTLLREDGYLYFSGTKTHTLKTNLRKHAHWIQVPAAPSPGLQTEHSILFNHVCISRPAAGSCAYMKGWKGIWNPAVPSLACIPAVKLSKNTKNCAPMMLWAQLYYSFSVCFFLSFFFVPFLTLPAFTLLCKATCSKNSLSAPVFPPIAWPEVGGIGRPIPLTTANQRRSVQKHASHATPINFHQVRVLWSGLDWSPW